MGKVIKIDLSDYTKVGHVNQIIDIDELESHLTSKATLNHSHSISSIENLSDILIMKL